AFSAASQGGAKPEPARQTLRSRRQSAAPAATQCEVAAAALARYTTPPAKGRQRRQHRVSRVPAAQAAPAHKLWRHTAAAAILTANRQPIFGETPIANEELLGFAGGGA